MFFMNILCAMHRDKSVDVVCVAYVISANKRELEWERERKKNLHCSRRSRSDRNRFCVCLLLLFFFLVCRMIKQIVDGLDNYTCAHTLAHTYLINLDYFV